MHKLLASCKERVKGLLGREGVGWLQRVLGVELLHSVDQGRPQAALGGCLPSAGQARK
jgi:hypothetical protein